MIPLRPLPTGNRVAYPPIRRPSCVATVNGTPVPVLSFEVESNNHFAADTWECSLALAGMPKGLGLGFWASQVPVTVQIFAGLNGPPATSLILGDASESGSQTNIYALGGFNQTLGGLTSTTGSGTGWTG